MNYNKQAALFSAVGMVVWVLFSLFALNAWYLKLLGVVVSVILGVWGVVHWLRRDRNGPPSGPGADR